MLAPQPPYALAPTTFRFAALAALAGRAPLGGRREVVLAVFLAARLAQDSLPDRALAPVARAERAANARTWLATTTLPSPVRPLLAALVDASAEDRGTVAVALRALIAATPDFLDPGAIAELSQLATGLETP